MENSRMKGWIVICLSVLAVASLTAGSGLPQELVDEITAQQEAVNSIMQYVMNGAGKHAMYDHLAVFSDDYGPRLSGSDDLEMAIDYVVDGLTNDAFDNIHREEVTVPVWTRGEESAFIRSPRYHRMHILSLGESVGTPQDGIEAEVVVVRSFDELNEKSAEVPGKIVVYNQPWVDYSQSVEYRARGASEASKHGAVGALVRSPTSFSVNSPHVGHQLYEEGVIKIPVACVTVEDAEMMQRLYNRGKTIVVNMTMTCENFNPTTSSNVIADLTGSEFPQEFVIIGGHIDTWDVGFGPMDDGAAIIMSWEAMRVLKALGLQAKRTVRSVFWTGEEFGLLGGREYFEQHKENNASISLIMEADSGTFKPTGIGFTGSGLARAIMEEIGQLLVSINTTVIGPEGYQPDTEEWTNIGVPSGYLASENQDYFIYHHSHGDSMTMQDPDVLDLCTVVWASFSYVVANLQDKLPRTGDYPEDTNTAPGLNVSGSSHYGGLLTALLIVSLANVFRSRRH